MTRNISVVGSVALLILYFGVEYFHWFSVEAISAHAIYFFEAIWVALVWIIFKKIGLIGKWSIKSSACLVVLLPFGWIVHAFARQQGIVIPFDFSSTETILFLLLIGPVLEELVFRGAMWRLIEVCYSKTFLLILITSLIFSYSHYQAVFSVPDEYKPFIYYQTAYTFVLSLICARLRIRIGLVGAIIAHILFNLGFWLGNRWVL